MTNLNMNPHSIQKAIDRARAELEAELRRELDAIKAHIGLTEETAPPATEETAPPATEETAPPATEETAPPATEETAPPATEETAPPATNGHDAEKTAE